MGNIIQTISYSSEKAKEFKEKLGEHLGIHSLTIHLREGIQVKGILSEVGSDYIALVSDDMDLVIRISEILYFNYVH